MRTSRTMPTSRTGLQAPALEAGLAVVEIVNSSPGPMKVGDIARVAGRPRGEIRRMLKVLESHGYVGRERGGAGYAATDKISNVGRAKPPIADLNSTALPEMRRLSDHLGQSAGLVVPWDGQVVFIAGVESADSFGVSMRLGYRRSILTSVSGRLLFAFQAPERQLDWLVELRTAAPRGADIESFIADARRARRDGWLIRRSVTVPGVIDICAPIWTSRGAGCAAALIVPLIGIGSRQHNPEDVATATRAAADRITNRFRGAD